MTMGRRRHGLSPSDRPPVYSQFTWHGYHLYDKLDCQMIRKCYFRRIDKINLCGPGGD
jgi:hypothetical protein